MDSKKPLLPRSLPRSLLRSLAHSFFRSLPRLLTRAAALLLLPTHSILIQCHLPLTHTHTHTHSHHPTTHAFIPLICQYESCVWPQGIVCLAVVPANCHLGSERHQDPTP